MGRVTDRTIFAAFILVPLGIWGLTAHIGHQYTMYLMGLVFLSACVPNVWIRSFGFYAAAWMFFIILMNWMGRLVNPNLLLTSMIATQEIMLAFILGLGVYRAKWTKGQWAWVICGMAAFQALLGWLQFFGMNPVPYFVMAFGIEPVYGIVAETPVGTLMNNNFLAAFLAVSIPYFLLLPKYLKWGGLGLMASTLVITSTSTAAGAALIGMAWFYFGWRWMALGIIPACVYAFWYEGHTLHNVRFDMWKDAIERVFQSGWTTLFGYGPGVSWRSDNHLHSEYMTGFFHYGVIGAFLMGAFLYEVRASRVLYAALLIAALDGIANSILETAPTQILCVVTIALIMKENQ